MGIVLTSFQFFLIGYWSCDNLKVDYQHNLPGTTGQL
jgi:hypothetical protein